MKNISHLILSALAILVLAGCGFSKSRQVAEKSVDIFHEQYNAEEFSEIYNGATPALRGATTEPKFLQFMTGVKNRFGEVTSTKQSGWRTNATTSGKFVLLSYDTIFERGSARESFVFAVSGENATLQGYNVNSPDIFSGSSGTAGRAEFSSPAEAQKEAVRRYPELGRSGSPLNREFLARHKRLQKESPEELSDPSWPLRVAEDSAKALKK